MLAKEEEYGHLVDRWFTMVEDMNLENRDK